jgi:hypothetical protein
MARAKTLSKSPTKLVLNLAPTQDFICVFLDGPWAGRRTTYKRDVHKFEVGRRPRTDEEGDCVFRYEPAAVRDVNGLKETDYHMTYDGPMFTEGKNG